MKENKAKTKQYFGLILDARLSETKLKQNTETLRKQFENCFKLIGIFIRMFEKI